MGRRPVLVAVVLIAATIATVVVVRAASHSKEGLCGARPFTASVMPIVEGAHVLANELLPPDCGQSYRRTITLSGGATTFDQEVQLLSARGWPPGQCSAPQRCFESPDHRFFAAIEPPRDAARVLIFLEPANGLNP
jgi:hypothetical protein